MIFSALMLSHRYSSLKPAQSWPLACYPAMSASAASECNEVKESVGCSIASQVSNTKCSRRYDSCFLKWYSESKAAICAITIFMAQHCLIHSKEFLRGSASTDECESLFKDYQACLTVGAFDLALCLIADLFQEGFKGARYRQTPGRSA